MFNRFILRDFSDQRIEKRNRSDHLDVFQIVGRPWSLVLFFRFSGALYVKNVFGETDRQEANQLISKIRQVFQENLDRLQWIDQKSRDEAKKKLKKITEKVGYPNYIHNRTALNERLVQSENLVYFFSSTIICFPVISGIR